MSRADAANASALVLLVMAEVVLVTVPMVTDESSSVVRRAGGGTVTTLATTHRPLVSLGAALPVFIGLIAICVAPLLLRRTAVARAARSWWRCWPWSA